MGCSVTDGAHLSKEHPMRFHWPELHTQFYKIPVPFSARECQCTYEWTADHTSYAYVILMIGQLIIQPMQYVILMSGQLIIQAMQYVILMSGQLIIQAMLYV
jgi:hypothetical protein